MAWRQTGLNCRRKGLARSISIAPKNRTIKSLWQILTSARTRLPREAAICFDQTKGRFSKPAFLAAGNRLMFV
jgi:hypothetical protein